MTKRKYKEDTPNNTIHKIRAILANLDIFVYESYWGNPYEGTFSVRVEADTAGGQFGTNGKGRTRQYALASAYAEFIERLQNGFVSGSASLNRMFLDQIKKETGFVFFPDEKIMTKDEFKNLPKEFLDDVFKHGLTEKEIEIYFNKARKNGYDGIISVPFFDVKNNSIIYLPYNIMLMFTGSNGMAAGNTISEGVFQGLCELYERYASSTVYFEKLTPPTIAIDFIKQYPSEYKLIKEIEKDGNYNVIVKDFSAGKHLPAIGVIIINKEKTKYKLNVGSDTSFPIALSRALTEIYQGYKDIKTFAENLLDVPQKELDYFINSDEQSIHQRDKILRKFIMNGSGVFPISLFGTNYSYEFDSSTFSSGDSYNQEVKKIINNFLVDGYNVYLRNVSFLGFPSFYIYIPTISAIGRKNASTDNVSLNSYVDFDTIEDLFFPSKNLSQYKIRKIANIIQNVGMDTDFIKMKDLLKLSFRHDSYWYHIPIAYFMVAFLYMLNDIHNAVNWMKFFMQLTNHVENTYYKNILIFLEAKRDGIDANIILGKNIANEISEGFKNLDAFFANIDLPQCPACEQCKLYSDCLTIHQFTISKRINKYMINTQMQQDCCFKEFL
ncbi:MAG: YcaO-like family protein [Prevotellaceae bacterium]|jgi:YcaO-like protein with predicted kinase domain|nr:YcaO-like family protein [Prevotellaceae bacterium]